MNTHSMRSNALHRRCYFACREVPATCTAGCHRMHFMFALAVMPPVVEMVLQAPFEVACHHLEYVIHTYDMSEGRVFVRRRVSDGATCPVVKK